MTFVTNLVAYTAKNLFVTQHPFMLYWENCLVLKLFIGDGIAAQSLYHRWSEKTLVDVA